MSRILAWTERVTRDFGAVRAVDSVTLELSEGEILGLIGPSGSGKTTLVRMLTGARAMRLAVA